MSFVTRIYKASSGWINFLILWGLLSFNFWGIYTLASSQFLKNNDSLPLSSGISQILNHVLIHAPKIKILALNLESQKLTHLIELSEFDIQASIHGSVSDRKDPRTTPYNILKSHAKTDQLGLEISKKWTSGVKTLFNYRVSENFLSLPSRSQSEYYLPDLSVQLEFDLFADIIYRQEFYKSQKVKQLNIQTQFRYNKEVYAILVNALVDTLSVLSIKELKTLEQEICLEAKKQQNKFLKKRIQRTVSFKDYLLSQKEVQLCAIEVDQLSSIELNYEQRIESEYGLKKTNYQNLDISDIFKQVKSLFESFKVQESLINWERILDLQSEILNLKVLRNEIGQLRAASQPRMIFEMRYGLKGLNSGFKRAQENIYNSDFESAYIGFRMDLPPFGRYSGKSREKSLYAASRYRLEAAQFHYFDLLNKKKSSFRTLKKTLSNKYKIFENLKKSRELSMKILSEATNDFNNGKINLFNLIEFRKSYLQSQIHLIRARDEILVGVIEYLDYFNFFEKYYTM